MLRSKNYFTTKLTCLVNIACERSLIIIRPKGLRVFLVVFIILLLLLGIYFDIKSNTDFSMKGPEATFTSDLKAIFEAHLVLIIVKLFRLNPSLANYPKL